MNFAQFDDENEQNDLRVLDILNEMRKMGLGNAFIRSLMENYQRYEGVQDLMEMWLEENDPAERTLIIEDIQEILEDISDAPKTPEERPYMNYNDLLAIKSDIIEFKLKLREEVDRQGGISELARRTGIPQPSLSRFFSSSSMPRRTTLYKIAKALNLSESAIGFKWTK